MKYILAAVCVLASGIGQAQKISSTKIPAAVTTSFSKAHPGQSVNWEREEGNYEANFKEGGRIMSCVIDRQGKILETETVITVSELPPNAKKYLDTHYKGKKIKEVAKTVNADGTTSFEAQYPGKEIEFDAAGNVKPEEKGNKKKD